MNDKYITLTWSFIRDKNTTMNEKIILMEIINLSSLDQGCFASNNHFAELMGVKKEAISRLISSLEKKGYISCKIKNGSRNFSRIMTLNKMLFDPKQNVISPLTNCLETKGNKLSNKRNNTTDDFISDLKSKVKLKSKVTKTKELESLLKGIEDKEALKRGYIQHQEEKGEYAKRITAYVLDYTEVKTDGVGLAKRSQGGYTF